MAKIVCATIITLIFCLFAVSIAADLPEKDESATQVSLPITESSPNTEPESESAALTTAPLTKMITFHPVNRHFDLRSKHPCRGRRHSRVYHAMRRENEQITYGNDMLVSSGENSDFATDLVLHTDDRRFPVRPIHHHHHHHHHDEDSDSDEDEDEDEDDSDRIHKKMKVLRKLKKHFGHQKEKEGGFMKRVRKFLDHYF